MTRRKIGTLDAISRRVAVVEQVRCWMMVGCDAEVMVAVSRRLGENGLRVGISREGSSRCVPRSMKQYGRTESADHRSCGA